MDQLQLVAVKNWSFLRQCGNSVLYILSLFWLGWAFPWKVPAGLVTWVHGDQIQYIYTVYIFIYIIYTYIYIYRAILEWLKDWQALTSQMFCFGASTAQVNPWKSLLPLVDFWRPFVHQVELLSSNHFPRLMDVPLPGARDSVQLKEKIHVPYLKSIDVKTYWWGRTRICALKLASHGR